MIVGIDPDSDKYGVALYEFGKLVELRILYAFELFEYILDCSGKALTFVAIEDVERNKVTAFTNRRTGKSSIDMSIAERIGRCKQSARVVEQFCTAKKIKLYKYPPQA